MLSAAQFIDLLRFRWSVGCFGWYCYSRHNSVYRGQPPLCRQGCYSAHISFPWREVPTCSPCANPCWNPPHIFRFPGCPCPKSCYCYRQHNSLPEFSAQGCYPRHILLYGRLQQPCKMGLLFTAHFKAGGIRRRLSGILYAGLLFNAQFIAASVFAFIVTLCFYGGLSAVVIVRTFLRFTAAFPADPQQRTNKLELLSAAQFNERYSAGTVWTLRLSGMV